MKRGQKCSICPLENVAQINAFLASGIKLKELSEQFPGLSVHALSRHKRNCLGTPATNGTGDTLDQQISTLLARSEQLWHSGGLTLDLRAQIASLGTSMRALEFKAKTAERQEEKAVRDLPVADGGFTSADLARHGAYMDLLIEQAATRLPAEPELRVWGLEIAVEKNPALLPVFQELATDQVLLATVQALMKGTA